MECKYYIIEPSHVIFFCKKDFFLALWQQKANQRVDGRSNAKSYANANFFCRLMVCFRVDGHIWYCRCKLLIFKVHCECEHTLVLDIVSIFIIIALHSTYCSAYMVDAGRPAKRDCTVKDLPQHA